MEVGVTGHNIESWPPKDHSCHVCFKLTYWFQRRRLLNIFSIGSYVKTKSSHGGHLFISDRQTIHKFSIAPPNDHYCKVTIQLAWWFLTRRFLKFQPMRTHYGPWQPCWFPIYTKNTNLVEDHPMDISGKFGWNLFGGFREEDLNVKS
jgi:hypothetical protein